MDREASDKEKVWQKNAVNPLNLGVGSPGLIFPPPANNDSSLPVPSPSTRQGLARDPRRYGLCLRGSCSPRRPLQLRGVRGAAPPVLPQGKELPTLKDVDFLNKNEKVFVEEEQQREFMEKLKRDVEVGIGGGCIPREPLRGGCLPP